MSAGKIDLIIEKGATYRKTFIWKQTNETPINLTGYTARAQIRENEYAASFDLELTTENGGIVITPLDGKIELYISDTDTSAVSLNHGVYDLELLVGSDVIKFLRGSVTLIEEITK